MSSHHHEDEFASFLAFTMAGLVVLAVIVAAWIIVKCLETVVRAVALHPYCLPLQIALGAFFTFLVLTILFGGVLPFIGGLCLVSALVLVLIAKITLVYYDTLFQRELNRATLTDQVLHEPWWNSQAA